MGDLHLEAGLTWCGENAEGEKEYVGTNKQWAKYEELKKGGVMLGGCDPATYENPLGERDEADN